MKSLIRLFRAVEIETKRNKNAGSVILEKTLKLGFVFSPTVIYNYSEEELFDLIRIIENEIGLTPEQMNNSFHKSWQKIKNASIEQLFLEQIIHYFTTYGFESLGIYNKESVYIPAEKLEIPKIDIDVIKIVVIHGYKKAEIKDKLLKMLKLGIALNEDTIKDVVEIAKQVGINQSNVRDINNKEVKISLCDSLCLFPEDPVEFLRYLVYKTTGKTLLIKDPATIEAIKVGDDLSKVTVLFDKYKKEFGLERLAEVFYRFKPIFLSFKTESSMRPIINKIRRLAVRHHKPMKSDLLNDITAMIKNNQTIDNDHLNSCLGAANNFRKIRLAYALKYRTKNADSILYKIRNGKGYASSFHFEKNQAAKNILDIIIRSLVESMRKNVAGKKIYIPSYIRYALPATEKQFTGNFPSGTCITVPKDMVFGIHWNDVDGERIDLDLSLMNMQAGKIGWDSSYRTEDRTILFSGDMTDSGGENGASELFYVKRQLKQEFIMIVNYYNYSEDLEVPFKIIVAREQAGNIAKNYMVNPNNIKATAKTKINEKQKLLGLIVTTINECRFYFSETSIGSSITSGMTDYAENCRRYLSQFYQNTISLNKLIEMAGAILVMDKNECDLDLSPESLEKDTIIKMLA